MFQQNAAVFLDSMHADYRRLLRHQFEFDIRVFHLSHVIEKCVVALFGLENHSIRLNYYLNVRYGKSDMHSYAIVGTSPKVHTNW
ncbi:hypothetical protein D3C81_2074750 [compost metagenome]